MSQEPSLWILSKEPWNRYVQDHSDNCSDQITLFSDKLEPVTIGPRVTTPKELSSSTPFLTLSERRPNHVTACKDSNLPTPWEEEPEPVWEHF